MGHIRGADGKVHPGRRLTAARTLAGRTSLLTTAQLLPGIAICLMSAMILPKLALVVFFHRLNPVFGFRRYIYVYTVVLTLATLIMGTIVIANKDCRTSQVCLGYIGIAHAVLCIIADLVLIALPLPTILTLRRPLRQRIMLGAVLALGSEYVRRCLTWVLLSKGGKPSSLVF